MTRVIAGRLRGRRIHAPKGSGTRPTSDRAREALFSALVARGAVDGARVLDLYAGSGALGIEAVSRGATGAVLVDHDRGAVGAMRRSLAELDLTEGEVRVQARAVDAYLRGEASPVDLVFLDPPYPLTEEALADNLAALADGWLADGALVVVERSVRSPEPRWPAGLEPVLDRRYGEARIWVAEHVP
ncbi:MAG TPA: 16S rRNA (guanine(966)-N(2))-methyltransferase RsmD [Intrasporangiaceae bacterium]|nr:16S rRNA (guanine(966)-N(2))-methyltransferase RsmD [Intrasporangiaceae bacterium]